LEFTIDRIVLANGRGANVAMMLQSQETQRHNNTGNVALSAVAGMIIGNMVGKTLFKSNMGGAIGAIAGALYGTNKRTNVSLRKGSTVVLEMRYAATIN